jgi:ankyrin
VKNRERAVILLVLLFVAMCLRGQENTAAEMLVKAAKSGDVKGAETLLSAGVDPDIANPGWRTPLCYAALYSRIDVAALLLAHHADPNAKPPIEKPNSDSPQTPLQIAASKGNLQMASMLASAGARVDIKADTGRTALHFAAVGGYSDVIHFLIEKGADVNVRDVNGVSPLDETVWRGHLEATAILLSEGARLNEAVKDTGATPINEAAFRGKTDVVRYLLKFHPNLLTPDRRGFTPLENSVRMGHEETAISLLEAASPEQKTPTFLSKIMDAAIKKDESLVVEKLLRNGVNVNDTLASGAPPLNSAAFEGAIKVVRVLLNAGIYVNRSGPDGITPLEDACLRGFDSVAAMLLDNGASVDATNSVSGETALYAAASFGRSNVVQMLLQRGADPNICTKDHITPYRTAVLNGYTDIARQIRQRGGSASCGL